MHYVLAPDERPDQTWFAMKIVNIQSAKTHLSRLVEEAAGGAEIVIAKAGKPLVKMIPFSGKATMRVLGGLQGQVVEREDCWSPDPELEGSFYEESAVPAARVAEHGS